MNHRTRFKKLCSLTTVLIAGLLTSCTETPEESADAVIMKDSVSPVMTMLCRSQDTAIMPVEYNDPGVLLQDETDNSPYLEVNGAVNHTLSGNYVLRYEARDAAGNRSVLTRTVSVIENSSAVLMGDYDATCTCTATDQRGNKPVLSASTYTAKITTGKKNRQFEILLLRVGPEDVLGQAALIGDSIELSFFSAGLNWQISKGSGHVSRLKDTLVFNSVAYLWDPVVLYKCRNKLVKKKPVDMLSF